MLPILPTNTAALLNPPTPITIIQKAPEYQKPTVNQPIGNATKTETALVAAIPIILAIA